MSKHFLIGAVVGGLFAMLFNLPPVGDVSVLMTLFFDVVWGAILAATYYFLFRGLVGDTKRSPEMRMRFAGTFFFWIGGLLALSVVMVVRGYPLLEATSTFLGTAICLTVAYHKLVLLYKSTGSAADGTPPDPPTL
ncbi:MAG: hypothetical protein Q7S52_02400 [bacterium]|nr:hypothetical protein [bacterium]